MTYLELITLAYAGFITTHETKQFEAEIKDRNLKYERIEDVFDGQEELWGLFAEQVGETEDGPVFSAKFLNTLDNLKRIKELQKIKYPIFRVFDGVENVDNCFGEIIVCDDSPLIGVRLFASIFEQLGFVIIDGWVFSRSLRAIILMQGKTKQILMEPTIIAIPEKELPNIYEISAFGGMAYKGIFQITDMPDAFAELYEIPKGVGVLKCYGSGMDSETAKCFGKQYFLPWEVTT